MVELGHKSERAVDPLREDALASCSPFDDVEEGEVPDDEPTGDEVSEVRGRGPFS